MIRPAIIRPLALLLAAVVLAAACSDGGDGADESSLPTAVPIMSAPDAPRPSNAATTTTIGADTATATTEAVTEATDGDGQATAESFTVRPGSEQVAVVGAEPGEDLQLTSGGAVDDGAGAGRADDLGSFLFRDVAPGQYQVVGEEGASDVFAVAALDDAPPASFYADQQLPAPGYGYLETRDGTTLSIDVSLPGPVEDGPYPTVVEYSGYQPSDPTTGGQSALYNTLGYAYVGVNMRGTGCSGGAYAFFEPVQSLDGYDAVEAIAAQPWVLGHHVGMVGLSYPGVSQLYVAATRPPSLAAITPLAVVDDWHQDAFYPGGIRNTTFTVGWAGARVADSAPAASPWAADRIADGDEECEANQVLRDQSTNLATDVAYNQFWTEEIAAPLAPRLLVDRIDVPVFLAGAWQDEQTSSRFATMLDRFTTDDLYVTLVNGLHIDPMSVAVFPRLFEFLELYVAERVPASGGVDEQAMAAGVFGADAVAMPAPRFAGQTYEAARAWFENEPPIEVLFESGAADGEQPGTPAPRWSASFFEWPIASTQAQPWSLGDGHLTLEPGEDDGATEYAAEPDELPATFHDPATGSVWEYDVEWQWEEPPDGTAASFLSGALADDSVYVGSASADLWIRTDATDTDLEVTLSEVRPDGEEVYVQSGWLRASQRALDPASSTELRPVPTFVESDAAPLVSGEWTPLRVELLPFGHAFRKGSQLRLTVDAPGNSRAAWTLETIDDGETVEVGWGPEHPSRLVLPLQPGLAVPAGLPDCTLRGQPCRAT